MKKVLISIILLITYSYAEMEYLKRDLNINEVKKVKNFYKTYLQKSCAYTATNFAQMHTQSEWKNIGNKNEFVEKILEMCPKSSTIIARILAKENGKINFNYLLYFSIQYAKGTGKVPPC
jgi:DNA-directed RNA polymerase subunit F